MKTLNYYITEKLKISKRINKNPNTFESYLIKLSELYDFDLDINDEKNVADFAKYLVYEGVIVELQDEQNLKIDMSYPNTDFFDEKELGIFVNELLENEATYKTTTFSNGMEKYLWLSLYVKNELVFSFKLYNKNNKLYR